jgi:hypothetical protein
MKSAESLAAEKAGCGTHRKPWAHLDFGEDLMNGRTDPFGRAYAGSQRQIQTYVNRRASELDAAIMRSLPELTAAHASFDWVSPLEEEGFVEYRGEAFLGALGLPDLSGMLASFWPRGGPVWDGLARVSLPELDRPGVLLVEAKSYPLEMYSNGCCASKVSRSRIVDALQRTQHWLGVDHTDWTGPLYQTANRLAHLYFLRELAGVPTWLVNVYFTGDQHRPTSQLAWQEALKSAKAALGLASGPIAFCADIILNAADSELFQTTSPVTKPSGKDGVTSGVDRRLNARSSAARPEAARFRAIQKQVGLIGCG